MPETVEEIQEIVRIANERRIPLWTHAAGMNNGYGGPAPRLKGSVIVSLRRMNRVLEINEDSAYAVVEPGVRWFDLYDAVRAGGHRLMVSIPDLGWGSVVGNTLENGATYLPNGADMAAGAAWRSCSRTARCSGPAWARCRATRPGMCTSAASAPRSTPSSCSRTSGSSRRWASSWRTRSATCRSGCGVEPGRPARARRDAARPHARQDHRERAADLEHIAFASVMSSRSHWYEGDEPIPDSLIDKMARELEVGRWMMLHLYGDEAVVDHKFRKVKEAFERISGAEVWGQKYAPRSFAEIENPHERVQASRISSSTR